MEQKSNLIKDTTKEERIALIREWLPMGDGLDECDIDLWDMYADYINGTKEIAECNEAFSKKNETFYTDNDLWRDKPVV